MNIETVIPLFPLGLVLLPEMSLPLHIFEERYKLMTHTCIEQRQEFGIVYFNGKHFEIIGCTARIEKILKRYDDGRLDIMTRGANRFAIKELIDEKPYLQAKIDYFDDQPGEKENREALQKLANSGLQLLKKINPLTQQYKEAQLPNQPDDKLVSFLMAACDGFSPEEKQRFLEMTSTAKRLRKALQALETLFERLNLTRKIERIIGGNGNLPKSL
jgi:Lon protease-like protein